jgi:hypothetical protein
MRSFFDDVVIIIRHNHVFKFGGAEQIRLILNDSFELSKLDLELFYDGCGFWTFKGNPDDVERLNEALKMFRILYRHHPKDYLKSGEKLVVEGVSFKE